MEAYRGVGNGAAGAGSGASQEFRGGGVHPASFRFVQQQQQQSGGSGDVYAPILPHPVSSASHASTPTPPLISPSTLSSSGHFASPQRSFQYQQQPQFAYSAQYPQYTSYPHSNSSLNTPHHHPTSNSSSTSTGISSSLIHPHFPTRPLLPPGHSPYSPRSPLSDAAPPVLRDARGEGGFRSEPTTSNSSSSSLEAAAATGMVMGADTMPVCNSSTAKFASPFRFSLCHRRRLGACRLFFFFFGFSAFLPWFFGPALRRQSYRNHLIVVFFLLIQCF
jgi:hypothetical protein